MKIIVQIYNHSQVIHTSDLQVYPLLAHDEIHKIDITPIVDEMLASQRQRLLPAEAHETNVDQGPHPG